MKSTPGVSVRQRLLDELLELNHAELVWILRKVYDERPEMRDASASRENTDKFVSLNDESRKDGYTRLLEPLEVSTYEDAHHTGFPLLNDTQEQPHMLSQAAAGSERTRVQFSANEFFCRQGDVSIELEVNRSGDKNMESAVEYYTADHSAISDIHYFSQTGTLVFPPGVGSLKIPIELKTNPRWEGLLEFRVNLKAKDDESITLHKQLQYTRVKIIGTSTFPSNKHKDQLRIGDQESIVSIGWVSLLFEYLRMNFSNQLVRRGTIRRCLFDQLHNVTFMVHLFSQVYLLDYVIVVDRPLLSFGFLQNRPSFLLGIALLDLLCVLLVHGSEWAKFSFPVGGPSRKTLMQGIMMTFLNMDFLRSNKVSEEDQLSMALARDSIELVQYGYSHSMKLVHTLGEVFMLVLFTVVSPLVFGRPFRPMVLVPFFVFPLAQTVFIYCRARKTTTALRERQEAQDEIVAYGHEATANRRMILDYKLRQVFVDRLESYISSWNAANRKVKKVTLNNKEFMVWLTSLLMGWWMIYGGMLVIKQSMSVAIFVTTFKVFDRLGKAFEKAYSVILQLQEVVPALVRICTILNSPTDLEIRQDHITWIHSETHRRRNELSAKFPSSALDHIPILIKDVEFEFASSCAREDPISFSGTLEIEQGMMVCLVGGEAEGKSSLIKLAGGAIIPKRIKGIVFIPAHLRVLHLACEPLFFRGSMLDNLSIGCVAPSDGDVARIQKVMELLDFRKRISLDDVEVLDWKNVLTLTECHKLNMVRALVANPHLLCVHKPTLVYDEETSRIVVEVLRKFVINRGVCQEDNPFESRRPRTCIFSSSKALATDVADVIYDIRGNRIELKQSAADRASRIQQDERLTEKSAS